MNKTVQSIICFGVIIICLVILHKITPEPETKIKGINQMCSPSFWTDIFKFPII